MQGQECDVVITRYGVSGPEYDMSEKEFIYSLNRLNVAITRAWAKTTTFLP
jgi:superfamily I DNA and/or RNA helicase